MDKIILSKKEIEFLHSSYPELKFDKQKNLISGSLSFCRKFNEKKICGKFSIEFTLEQTSRSILPIARETEGKIYQIAVRKGIPYKDLHLNSLEGELCIIIPAKEKEYYPNGFELHRFLDNLETHFYWIVYFDRYDEKPWPDQAHEMEGYYELCRENKKYRPILKRELEINQKRKISRSEFRQILREKKLL